MDLRDTILVGFFSFFRNVVGLVARPYETMRRIARTSHLTELPALVVFLLGYFALSSLVKTAAFRPYILTKQFIVLCFGAGFLYGVTSFFLWRASALFGGSGKYKTMAVSWAYTLIPTGIWFLITSLLFVILPPPRTSSFQGILFSILYLIFSVTLLFWKIILAYLAVRFSMKLDLARIIGASIIASPFVAAASVFLYRFGIFRVPFV